MTQIPIPSMTIVLQAEEKGTATTLDNVVINDDLTTCVIGQWSFAGKQFNLTLWDENTTPSYEKIGVWTYEDAVNRMIELTK